MWMTPAAEEAWRSNPAAQRFEWLLARRDKAEANPGALALPCRLRHPRPGVWCADSGLYFVCRTPDEFEQYGDTYTEVIDRVEHVFHRVDAARWAFLREHLADPSPIREALVDLFGEAGVALSESTRPAEAA